jgi:hypothetical protein
VKPHIDGTAFGSITIEGVDYDHDVVVTPAGEIVERRKELSKRATGTSHVVSKDEAEFLLGLGARRLIVGSGQSGVLRLSDEARALFNQHGCDLTIAPTPEAIELYNAAGEPVTAMFHTTC